MLIRINPNSAEPLFTQLVTCIRGGIIAGEIAIGERLPSARDLATSLGVNMHTVLRAYNELRDAGLIELRRGRGAVVIDTPAQTTEVDHAIDALVQLALHHGVTPDAVRERMEHAWAQHAPPPSFP